MTTITTVTDVVVGDATPTTRGASRFEYGSNVQGAMPRGGSASFSTLLAKGSCAISGVDGGDGALSLSSDICHSAVKKYHDSDKERDGAFLG